MKFSLESDYAVRIVLQIYISPKKREKSSEVLEECRIPPKLGQRTITKLVKAEVLRSIRGNAGGVEVIKRPEDLSLYEVISAVESATKKYHPIPILGKINTLSMDQITKTVVHLPPHLTFDNIPVFP